MSGLNLYICYWCVTSHYIFQIKDIKHTVPNLKPNEGLGSLASTSDHVVNAGCDSMCYIAFVFTLFVVHRFFLKYEHANS